MQGGEKHTRILPLIFKDKKNNLIIFQKATYEALAR